jgi:hypothetical protein
MAFDVREDTLSRMKPFQWPTTGFTSPAQSAQSPYEAIKNLGASSETSGMRMPSAAPPQPIGAASTKGGTQGAQTPQQAGILNRIGNQVSNAVGQGYNAAHDFFVGGPGAQPPVPAAKPPVPAAKPPFVPSPEGTQFGPQPSAGQGAYFGEGNASYIRPGAGYDPNAPINSGGGIFSGVDQSRTYGQGMEAVRRGLQNPNEFTVPNGGYASGGPGRGTVSVLGGPDLTGQSVAKEAAHRAGMAALRAGGSYEDGFNAVQFGTRGGILAPRQAAQSPGAEMLQKGLAMIQGHLGGGSIGDELSALRARRQGKNLMAMGTQLTGQEQQGAQARGLNAQQFQQQLMLSQLKAAQEAGTPQAQAAALKAGLEGAALSGNKEAMAKLQEFNALGKPVEYKPVKTMNPDFTETVQRFNPRTGELESSNPQQDMWKQALDAATKEIGKLGAIAGMYTSDEEHQQKINARAVEIFQQIGGQMPGASAQGGALGPTTPTAGGKPSVEQAHAEARWMVDNQHKPLAAINARLKERGYPELPAK